MKNLPLNEKHLADKLQHVPVPDVDQGWEQMRSLLDREMPEPVVGAWSGNRKWWWMGITAAVVMVAAWLGSARFEGEGIAKVGKGEVVKEGKVDEGNLDEKHQGAVSDKDVKVNSSAKIDDPDAQMSVDPGPDKNVNSEGSVPSGSVTKGNAISGNSAGSKSSPVSVSSTISGNETAKQPDSKQKTSVRSKSQVPGNDNRITNYTTGYTSTNIRLKNNPPNNKQLTSGRSTATQSTSGNPTLKQPTPDLTPDNIVPDNSTIEASSFSITLASAAPPAPSEAFTEIQPQVKPLAVAGKTDKAFAREVRKKSIKADNRRMSKSNMRGNSREKDHELTFAAGLALPYSMPVSGQQAVSYNIAAGNSRITDYLPAPYFQYHVNDRVFLQTELQFQSPQHTQRLLLSQSTDTFMNMRYERTGHLEKLYYFNIPFNVYYSPLRNFYIGGGLQYSSLLGGVATYEDRSTNGQTVVNHNSITRRFKDDSAAAVFSPSEWRYQFDANYYINRFSFGLRYNQSMKDYINVQVGPAATVGRNRSFLLYVRFNIWEERKKTAN